MNVAVDLAKMVQQEFVVAAANDTVLAAEQPDLPARVSATEEVLSRLLRDVDGLSPHASSLVLSAREQLKEILLLVVGLGKPLANDAFAKLFKNQKKERAKMREKLKVSVDRLVTTSYALDVSTANSGRSASSADDAADPPGDVESSAVSSISSPTMEATPAGNAAARFWSVTLSYGPDFAAASWPDFERRLRDAMTAAGGALDLSGVPDATREGFWIDLRCALMPNAGEVVTPYALEDFVGSSGAATVETAIEAFVAGHGEREVSSGGGGGASELVAERQAAEGVIAQRRKLLWIDDRPENNEDIVRMATEVGARVGLRAARSPCSTHVSCPAHRFPLAFPAAATSSFRLVLLA